jgi:hypothetical protein
MKRLEVNGVVRHIHMLLGGSRLSTSLHVCFLVQALPSNFTKIHQRSLLQEMNSAISGFRDRNVPKNSNIRNDPSTIWTDGPDSSVGIVTGYGLDGPGIEFWWGRDCTCPDRPWGQPRLLYNGYCVFAGGRNRPGCDADPSPLLVPRSKNSTAIPLLSLRAFVTCKKGEQSEQTLNNERILHRVYKKG